MSQNEYKQTLSVFATIISCMGSTGTNLVGVNRDHITPSFILTWFSRNHPNTFPFRDITTSYRGPISVELTKFLHQMKTQNYCDIITLTCGSYHIIPKEKIYQDRLVSKPYVLPAKRALNWTISHNDELWKVNILYLAATSTIERTQKEIPNFTSQKISREDIIKIITEFETIIGKKVMLL